MVWTGRCSRDGPHGTRFTWKWEFLRGFLGSLQTVLPVLAASFDSNLMVHGSGGGDDWNLNEINAAVIREIEGLMRDAPKLTAQNTILLMVSAAVQREASWQERCWCHEHLMQEPGKTVRQRLASYRTAAHKCPWRCHRGGELAAGGAARHVSNLQNATSKELRQLLLQSTPAQRQDIMKTENKIKTAVIEQVRIKLSPWSALPLKMLGIIPYKQSGDLSFSQQICAECIQERDDALAVGRGMRLHRAVHKLMVDESLPFRRELELFGRRETNQLGPNVAWELWQYCMSPTVTRKTDGGALDCEEVAGEVAMDVAEPRQHEAQAGAIGESVERQPLLRLGGGSVEIAILGARPLEVHLPSAATMEGRDLTGEGVAWAPLLVLDRGAVPRPGHRGQDHGLVEERRRQVQQARGWVPERNRCPCLCRRKWALVRSYLAWASGPPMLHGVWHRVVG